MGPFGWQEMVFIFIFALLIFGPKKLPELGKTIGKAMTEFRRASSDLKATFDREMSQIETETRDLKQTANSFQNDLYNHDSSYYDSGAYGSDYDSSTYNPEPKDNNASNPPTVGASATQGADSNAAKTPEGTVATAERQPSAGAEEPGSSSETRNS